MISCRDWRPWKKPFYIAMTQKQSRNEWNGGIAARPVPKFPSAKIRWKGFRLDFLVSRRYLPHWLSSKGSNYQRGYYSPLLVQLKDILKEKRRGKVTKVFLSLHDSAAAHWALHPEVTGLSGLPMSWSPTLFSGSGPVGLLPVPWTDKNNWKFATSCPSRKLFLPQRPGWTDNLLNFFCVACKS